MKSGRSRRKKRKAPVAARSEISKRERTTIMRSLRKHDEVGRLLAEWDRKHSAGGGREPPFVPPAPGRGD